MLWQTFRIEVFHLNIAKIHINSTTYLIPMKISVAKEKVLHYIVRWLKYEISSIRGVSHLPADTTATCVIGMRKAKFAPPCISNGVLKSRPWASRKHFMVFR